MSGRLPDFLVIGGMRCGSTTLHNVLSAHSQIYLPDTKELHFFDRRNPVMGDDLTQYKAAFAGCSDEQICGEITPDYLTTPGCAQRIAATLTQPKLVVILREPSARLCSHYLMSVANGVEPHTLNEALDLEASRLQQQDDVSDIFHSYYQRSDYLPHLQRYQQQFGRDSLHVLFLEELNNNPQPVLERLLLFLGVTPTVNQVMLEAVSVTNRNADIFRLRLSRWQRWWHRGRSLFGQSTAPTSKQPVINRQHRQRLQTQFADANTALSAWLGRTLPW